MAAPLIDVTSVSRSRISANAGVDQSVVYFETDQNLTNWETRAGGAGLGQGLLVGTPPAYQTNWDAFDGSGWTWAVLDSRSFKFDQLMPIGSPSAYRERWSDFENLGWTWATLDSCRLSFARLACVLPVSTNVDMYDLDHATWSKSYNTAIVFTYDGPVAGRVVATFADADTDGGGYWFRYGDYAPQTADTWYRIRLRVKTPDRQLQVYAYTGDNTEAVQGAKGRIQTNTLTVPASPNWYLCEWYLKTDPANISDSLSFRWTGLTGGARMSIHAPEMTPVGRFEIDNEELTQGDKVYRIDVYGKNQAGEWTPYAG
jgi:hypothetical protein